jgi:hypothetical protein
VARAIEPGFDDSAAAAAAVRADLNGDRGAASGASFIPVEQVLAGFGGGCEHQQHQALPPEHPSAPPPLQQQQPASGGFMALLMSDDPRAAADALAIGGAASLPPPYPAAAGDAVGGWGEAAGSSNSLSNAAGTWLHPEGQQQQGAPMLAALHGTPFLNGGQLLLPGAGSLSGSSQNYLQHQQRMMLAHQQQQTHLQVMFAAEEKARRKEKKRAKRLLKQQLQQQQNRWAGSGQQAAATAPSYGSALLGAGRYTFTGDASAAVMAAAAGGPLTSAATRLFPPPAAAGGRSSSGVLSRYSPYPAGSPLQLSRAASMGGELPASAGAAPGAVAAAGAWGAPRMLQSRSLPGLLRLPGVPVTDEDTGQLDVLEGVVVSMPAGEAAGGSTTEALGQQHQRQQLISHPGVQTSPLSTNTQQQLPQLQQQLSAAERVLQHAGASGTLAPGQPLGLTHGGGSMGSQQLMMQRAGSASLAEGAGTPGALLSLMRLPSLQTQQQPGQAARAAPRRKGKAAAAGASGANGETGNGPGVDLAVSSSIMRTSSGKVLR